MRAWVARTELLAADERQLQRDDHIVLASIELAGVCGACMVSAGVHVGSVRVSGLSGFPNFAKRRLGRLGDHTVVVHLVRHPPLGLPRIHLVRVEVLVE